MGHAWMKEVKSSCLYMLYSEHGPCSRSHALSVDLDIFYSMYTFVCYHIATSLTWLTSCSITSRLSPRLVQHHHPPSPLAITSLHQNPPLRKRWQQRKQENEPKQWLSVVWAAGIWFFPLSFIVFYYLSFRSFTTTTTMPLHPPSLTRNMSWTVISSILAPAAPLPPPSLETQDGGGFYSFSGAHHTWRPQMMV